MSANTKASVNAEYATARMRMVTTVHMAITTAAPNPCRDADTALLVSVISGHNCPIRLTTRDVFAGLRRTYESRTVAVAKS